MKLTEEQRWKIVKELDPENKEGILCRLIEDIHRVFWGIHKISLAERPYLVNVEELRELTKALGHFDREAYDRASYYVDPEGCCGEYLDYYKLYDEEGECYFDFDKDVYSILNALVNCSSLCYPQEFRVNVHRTYDVLKEQSKDFIQRKLNIMPGYYYYEKDHYGTEKCEYVGENIQSAKFDVLDALADGFPTYGVGEFEWKEMQQEDRENPFIQARNRVVQQALDDGKQFPFILVTHFHDDLNTKYECVKGESEIDYDELIHEYAEPKAYKIEPTFIRGTEITRQQAIERGMYALAQEIELNEVLTEEKDDTEE